jgi:hypothetical protein
MIIYISGPMTGLPEFNFPAFNAAAAQLRSLGYEVINPAEFGEGEGKTWTDYMRKDIKALMDCTHVAVLPGWENSNGARLEVYLAGRLEMPVKEVGDYTGAEL